MDINDFLNNVGVGGDALSFSLVGILKLPMILIMIGNILFSVLLFLRVRILADTFKTPDNKIVQSVVALYMFGVIIGSLLSLFFVMLK